MNAQNKKLKIATSNDYHLVVGEKYSQNIFNGFLENLVFDKCEFKKSQWIGANCQNIHFVDCVFEDVEFINSSLKSIEWERCKFHNLYFSDMSIHSGMFMGAQIKRWKIISSSLNNLNLLECKGSEWIFDEIDLKNSTWMQNQVENLEWRESKISDMSWFDQNINDLKILNCYFERFVVAQSKINKCFFQKCLGMQVRWIQCELHKLDYMQCRIASIAWSHSGWSHGHIVDSVFDGASFDSANLNQLQIKASQLPRMMMDNAKISNCDFSDLESPRSSLRGANLSNVSFVRAQLTGLDARGATLNQVDLNAADCRNSNLVGQNRSDWLKSDNKNAKFEDEEVFNDHFWWVLHRPGFRGVLP